MNYTYFNPTAIEFGTDKIKSIVNYIDKKKKVLVVYGGGSIKKMEFMIKLKQHLRVILGLNLVELSQIHLLKL